MHPPIFGEKVGVLIRDPEKSKSPDGVVRGKICQEIRQALAEKRPVFLVARSKKGNPQ